MNNKTVYLGFWLRLWATLIDTLWLAGIIFFVLFLIYGKHYTSLSSSNLSIWSSVIHWVVPAILVIAFWFIFYATPGKLLLRAKIVDANTGLPPSRWRLTFRYFAYFVSFIPFCLGFFWMVFDAKKQGWHDKLVGTVVIRDLNRPILNRLLFWSSSLLAILLVVIVYIFLSAWLMRVFVSNQDPSLKIYISDGFNFGNNASMDTCWQETKWRLSQCHDIYCQYGQMYFFKACLAASEATRNDNES